MLGFALLLSARRGRGVGVLLGPPGSGWSLDVSCSAARESFALPTAAHLLAHLVPELLLSPPPSRLHLLDGLGLLLLDVAPLLGRVRGPGGGGPRPRERNRLQPRRAVGFNGAGTCEPPVRAWRISSPRVGKDQHGRNDDNRHHGIGELSSCEPFSRAVNRASGPRTSIVLTDYRFLSGGFCRISSRSRCLSSGAMFARICWSRFFSSGLAFRNCPRQLVPVRLRPAPAAIPGACRTPGPVLASVPRSGRSRRPAGAADPIGENSFSCPFQTTFTFVGSMATNLGLSDAVADLVPLIADQRLMAQDPDHLVDRELACADTGTKRFFFLISSADALVCGQHLLQIGRPRRVRVCLGRHHHRVGGAHEEPNLQKHQGSQQHRDGEKDLGQRLRLVSYMIQSSYHRCSSLPVLKAVRAAASWRLLHASPCLERPAASAHRTSYSIPLYLFPSPRATRCSISRSNIARSLRGQLHAHPGERIVVVGAGASALTTLTSGGFAGGGPASFFGAAAAAARADRCRPPRSARTSSSCRPIRSPLSSRRSSRSSHRRPCPPPCTICPR